MERREISTAISDFILFLSAGRCAYYGYFNWSFPLMAVGGFACISVAAGCGFVRFGQFAGDMHDTVKMFHELTTYLSSVTGMALIADSYITENRFIPLRWLLYVFITLGFFGHLLPPSWRRLIKDIAGPVSLGIIITMCILSCKQGAVNFYGIFGCVSFIVGGLLMMTNMTVIGTLKTVDIFHYLAAVGIVMLAGGLRWRRYNC